MDEGSTAAIIGLVLGLLPVALIVLGLVAVVVIVALIIGLFWLLEQHPWCWVYFISLTFNVIVLVPLWVVVWVASSYEPDLWAKAEEPVYIFSVAFVLPTSLFYFLWKRAEKNSPNE